MSRDCCVALPRSAIDLSAVFGISRIILTHYFYGAGVFFVTKFYFTECQSFARYSPKNMNILCLQHKTVEESDAFA